MESQRDVTYEEAKAFAQVFNLNTFVRLSQKHMIYLLMPLIQQNFPKTISRKLYCTNYITYMTKKIH